MFKHFCFLGAATCSLWSLVIALFAAACSSGGKNEGDGEKGVVSLFLGKLQVPFFDSVSVHISATDMESIHISQNSVSDNLRMSAIPQGENRKFEVKIYADSGKLVQNGEAVADIIADESITIPITLSSLAGFLKLEVPLGIPNNTGVSSGKLFLKNLGLEFNMKIENGKGVFNTGSLPLDKDLELVVELYDYSGAILFDGSKILKLSSFLQTETIQLKSTMGSVVLELQAENQGPTQILAMLPPSVSKSRVPQNYGELFFTEIYAIPPDGNNFQYMELFNITLDSLNLKGCTVGRQIDSPSSYRFTIGDLIILPMKYAILGRSGIINANYNYGTTFNLLVTGQSLGLFCNDLIVDTLTYSGKGDNIFPLEKGRAMQLPLENYGYRTKGSAWCFGFSPGQDAECD